MLCYVEPGLIQLTFVTLGRGPIEGSPTLRGSVTGDCALKRKAVLLKNCERELLGLCTPTLSWQCWVVSNGQGQGQG